MKLHLLIKISSFKYSRETRIFHFPITTDNECSLPEKENKNTFKKETKKIYERKYFQRYKIELWL